MSISLLSRIPPQLCWGDEWPPSPLAASQEGGEGYCVEMCGRDWKLFRQNDSGMYFYDSKNMTRSSSNIVEVWTKLKYTVKM